MIRRWKCLFKSPVIPIKIARVPSGKCWSMNYCGHPIFRHTQVVVNWRWQQQVSVDYDEPSSYRSARFAQLHLLFLQLFSCVYCQPWVPCKFSISSRPVYSKLYSTQHQKKLIQTYPSPKSVHILYWPLDSKYLW